MLKFYNIKIKFYNKNGDLIGYDYNSTILTEKEPENHVDVITWDNLSEYYKAHAFNMPFSLWNFKKGRLISFYDRPICNKKLRDLKEWKDELYITAHYEYIEINPSIQYILNWHNGSAAIQYLCERGLNIVKGE